MTEHVHYHSEGYLLRYLDLHNTNYKEEVMGKKKITRPIVKCPKCGLDCIDETTLKRHIDWAHQEEANK